MALCMMKSINCTLFVFMIFIVVVDDVFPLTRLYLLFPFFFVANYAFSYYFVLTFSLFLLFY